MSVVKNCARRERIPGILAHRWAGTWLAYGDFQVGVFRIVCEIQGQRIVVLALAIGPRRKV